MYIPPVTNYHFSDAFFEADSHIWIARVTPFTTKKVGKYHSKESSQQSIGYFSVYKHVSESLDTSIGATQLRREELYVLDIEI